ncbi:MAG TPA: hypothetical protein VFU45_06525 [Gemmatimonadales bacterium]|nr:hypothetical protein [Gemmatimonadales bacterium]
MSRPARWTILGAALTASAVLAGRPGVRGDPAPTAVTLDGNLDARTDDSPAFTPDGATAFFDRTAGRSKTIVMTTRIDGHWTPAVTAPFSGQWLDPDPALAPDGSALVFSSNRPVHNDGQPVVFTDDGGKAYRGANLWKVARQGEGWGTPEWLGPAVNTTTLVVAPSVAQDGSVYFIQRERGAMHIFRSDFRDGKYLPARLVALGDTTLPTHDPAIAPDRSFLVFDYGQSSGGLGRLSIAFRQGDGWSAPHDLGDAANSDAPWGAHLGPDARTLYFTGNTHIWRLSLAPWLPAD